MKKLLLTLLTILSILLLFFFFTKQRDNLPAELVYDAKPYKIKPESKANSSKITAYTIYDSLSPRKQPVVEGKLSTQERPVLIEDVFNEIDQVISNIIDAQQLTSYKGIKVVVHRPNAEQELPLLAAPLNLCKGYVLDMGIYANKQEAITKLGELEQLYPKTRGQYTINPYHLSTDILHHLRIEGIADFNTAKTICDKLKKYKENCVIINLGE
jgi:hypothetical protein